MKAKPEKLKIYCLGCGRELLGAETFPDTTYCRIYGCCCCPDKNEATCQKDKLYGTFLDVLEDYEA